MDLANDPIFTYLAQFAYQPGVVYSLIIALMLASSFGMPFPEEITLISAGFIAHMALHPEVFPPPIDTSAAVNPITIAVICLFSVFGSDFLVFMLGRKYGSRMLRAKIFERYRKSTTMRKVEGFTEKYGALACGIFRFTPGLRFPGHFACGSMGIPKWKFIVVDGTAALLTVPTQVLLIAYYGEFMLEFMKEFKVLVILVIVGLAVFYLVRKYILKKAIVVASK